MNLSEHEDENVREHKHEEGKEEYFNNYVFDSQFKRYAQVLDTDYDDYLFVYHCIARDESLEAKLDGSEAEDEDAVERKELA